MEKIKTTVNLATAKELSKKQQILVIVGFITGIACVALGVTFTLLNPQDRSILYLILIILGGLLVAFAGMLGAALFKRYRIYKNNNYESSYEFFDDHIQLIAYQNGDKFQEAKIKYTDIYGYIELKNYVIVKLNNMNTLPIAKASGLIEYLESKGVQRRKK